MLATAGYAAFTTRAVAAAAGITPGNLAYHYASKRDLLRAVISSLIAEYARHIDGYLADPANRAHDGFSRLAVWLIQDSAARVTSRLSRELWAMALNDPFVRDALDDFYARSAERIIAVLRRSHPGLSESAAREVVHLLMMISEGANPIYGTASPAGAPIARVSKLATEALRLLIQELESGS